MNKTFSIKGEQLECYVKRQIKVKNRILFSVFGAFSLFFLIGMRFQPISLMIALFFGFIGLMAFLSSKNGATNMAKSIQFTITDDAVIQSFNQSQMDALTKTSMEINAMKYGTKFNKVFPYHKIESTEIRENDLRITSKDSSFLDENNVIKIPKECNDFDELLAYVRTNSDRFKLR